MAFNQAVAPGITSSLHATAETVTPPWGRKN